MHKIVTCLISIVTSCSIAAVASGSNLDRVIAIVNDDAITMSDYETFVNLQSIGKNEATVSGDQPIAVDVNKLEALIDQRLQIQEAFRSGFHVTRSELDIAVSNISQQNGVTVEELLKRLASNNISESELRQSMRDQILMQKVVNERVSQFVRVNEQEIDQFVKSYPDLFNVNVLYELSRYSTDISNVDSETIKTRRDYLELGRMKVLAGEKLEDALDVSDSDSIEYEYLGWRAGPQIPYQVLTAIGQSSSESITEVLEMANTLHLFVIHAREGDEMIVTQFRLRQILIDPNRKYISNAQALDLAEEIAERIKAGEDFASLARSYSDDQVSAGEGGEMGWLNPNDINAQLLQVISELEINELSEPVSTLFGYYLIEVLETRTRNILQDVIRARARDMIFNRKAGSQFNSWIGQIRSESYIEILEG